MISVSVPGRICLFGEHQDYLKLPVITASISLRVEISGEPTNDYVMHLDLPDINSELKLPLIESDAFYKYETERDYFKSVANILKQNNFELTTGCKCIVRGNIPINSGTSSSSALNVAWCKFLIELNKEKNPVLNFDTKTIAHMAYLAEVEEFGEPGGTMDQYATAIGGVLLQEFNSEVILKNLQVPNGDFVLGDSGEPKDTKKILNRVKIGVINAVEKIQVHDPKFELKNSPVSTLQLYQELLTNEQLEVLEGAILNRDIMIEARNLFSADSFNEKEFGKLLSQHQDILANKLKISTSKIDKMLQNAIKAGAYGGKINGSGGGGCMFVYAPENTKKVAKAIKDSGGKAHLIKIDKGIILSD